MAPLSGRPCLLYRVDTGWRELFSAGGRQLIAGLPFELSPLDLGTGGGPTPTVQIDASEASITLPSRRQRTRDSADPALARRLEALCDRLSRRPPRLPGRWREATVEVGQALRVSGWLSWIATSDAFDATRCGYREPPRQPRLRAQRIEVHL